MTKPQAPTDHRGRELIGTERARRILGVTDRTVTRWADDGTLPVATRTRGGHRRYRLGDVTDLRDQLAREAAGVEPEPVDHEQTTIALGD